MRIDEDAIEAYARDAARRVAARARPRGRRRRDPRRVQPAAQRDQLRLAAGSRRCASRRACPASARSRPGCAPAGRGRRDELQTITREEIATTLGQDPEHALMGLFERHLRELGERVDGSFLAFARSGDRPRRSRPSSRPGPPGTTSRPTTAATIPFFKRAQIAAADLALAGPRDPPTTSHRLTLFADNLVPHVLRIDGVLEFDDDLVAPHRRRHAARARLARGGRDPRRARCTRSSCWSQAHGDTTATAVDNVLWNRGARAALQGAPPPPRPHHRLLTLVRARGLPRAQARAALRRRDRRGRPATRPPRELARRSRPTSQPASASSRPPMGSRATRS